MPQGLTELQPGDLVPDMEAVLLPRLAGLLRSRQRGHCMRVNDLDEDVMTRLCRRLRQEVPESQVYVLQAAGRAGNPADLYATSTKLVELRNPAPDGSQRSPLLVFLPPNLRSSAEDSFGVATFEEVDLGDVYAEMAARLRQSLPDKIRGPATEFLDYLRDERWRWAGSLAESRYIRTVLKNDVDSEAAGAALFELGLVPDLRLLDEPAAVLNRVKRNRGCVEKLTISARSERGRVLDLRLKSQDLRAKLGSFLVESGLGDPRVWARRIVADPNNHHLTFDKWEFEDAAVAGNVCVEVLGVELPVVDRGKAEDSTLHFLVGKPCLALGPQGPASFKMTFQVTPHPAQVDGLAHFELQVVSQERGTTGVKQIQRRWAGGQAQKTVTFKKANKLPLEEGWHFIRIRALTEDGDFVPLVDTQGRPLTGPEPGKDGEEARRLNESELFFVLSEGGEVEADSTAKEARTFPSLEHARLELQFDALAEGRDPAAVQPDWVRWPAEAEGKGKRAGAGGHAEARLGPAGVVHITIPGYLKALEQKILDSPERAVSLRVSARNGSADPPLVEPVEKGTGAVWDAFLVARHAFVESVRGGKEALLCEATDFQKMQAAVADYAGRYRDLIDTLLRRVEASSGTAAAQAAAELNRALAVDSVYLVVSGHPRGPRDAVLLGPTHPLRALWVVAWSRVGASWLGQLQQAGGEQRERYLGPTRSALLEDMAPLHFPAAVPLQNGRLFTAVENLNPFWALYAPSREEDLRGLVGEVCAALRLPEPAARGSRLSGRSLATRVQRYLVQHPYIRTLTLNVFNPGSGQLVADLLVELQRTLVLRALNFDVRLFAADLAAPGLGEALRCFLSPAAGSREADAFAAPSGNHLTPKLALAVRDVADFRERPADYPAHLSLLFDEFPPEEVSAGPPLGTA
jgi:hypothetical protein